MKARFELMIYLPFLLPRDSKDWGREHFVYRRNDYEIGFVALPQDNAQQAIKPVENLQAQLVSADSASIESLDYNHSQITKEPHRYFYEVLLVAITGEIPKKDAIYDPEIRAKYLNIAISELRRFFDFCRAFTMNTAIHFDTPSVSPDNLTFDGFPHSEGWHDPISEQPLGDSKVNFTVGEFTQGRVGIVSVPWHRVRAAVRSTNDPPLHRLTLIDARKAFDRFEDRQAILLAAIAVEIGIKSALHKSHNNKAELIELEKSLKQEFWKKYFDFLPKLSSLPSLKDTDVQLYKMIAKLFRVRNKIAHEGVPYLEKDKNDAVIPLSRAKIFELVGTADKTINWIDSIMNK